jgi:hypothetical protein
LLGQLNKKERRKNKTYLQTTIHVVYHCFGHNVARLQPTAVLPGAEHVIVIRGIV